MTKKVRIKRTLLEALLPLAEEDSTDLVVEWGKLHDIQLTYKGTNQYKVHNGCIPAIMFYPTKMKLMFQENGKTWVIESKTEEGVLGLIQGHIAFKKPGE